MAVIKPLKDRVLIKPIEPEKKSPGGIIIPDSAQEKPKYGEIIAVGNGYKDDKGSITPLDVKVGDVVLFAKWGGAEVNLEGTDYLIMKESDILAIIDKKN